MIAVAGTFRFPAATLAEARPLMRQVIVTTLAERGCHAYSYAEDVAEPGLFRVFEIWENADALHAHFATAHMRQWVIDRERLGFYDRDISMHTLGAGAPI